MHLCQSECSLRKVKVLHQAIHPNSQSNLSKDGGYMRVSKNTKIILGAVGGAVVIGGIVALAAGGGGGGGSGGNGGDTVSRSSPTP